jgi:hypothetical protein
MNSCLEDYLIEDLIFFGVNLHLNKNIIVKLSLYKSQTATEKVTDIIRIYQFFRSLLFCINEELF